MEITSNSAQNIEHLKIHFTGFLSLPGIYSRVWNLHEIKKKKKSNKLVPGVCTWHCDFYHFYFLEGKEYFQKWG